MRIMKSFAVLAVLGALVVPVAARAQTAVQANIPFEFAAGGSLLPPGSYQFETSSHGRILAVQGMDRKTRWLLMASRAYRFIGGDRPGKVVFNKYGNRYFLSEVWSLGEEAGHRLPKTRQEREASLKASAQPFMVAAR
ncbi:MAG: hypothetical protein FJW34_11210 [Acidobacteria bacterium]|nr:hypothetical protein [Acidobacteriota bacterium]